ncbi:MAG: hypothetical protein H0X34_15630 [Chthoniobacterales bacterium]|nr:hypothetical protein [Chthoniobacterales bacterium]
MAAQNFRVIFAESAWNDIGEIVGYWTDRDEPERGEQYAHDLPTEAIRQMGDPGRDARRPSPSSTPPIRIGRSCRSSHIISHPLPRKEADGIVEALRVWQGYRDEPFNE